VNTRYVPILAKTAKVFPLTISQGNIVFPSLPLVLEGISIVGSPLAPVGSQRQMLEFAALHGIKPQIEKFPLTQTGITDAMQRLRDGKMRYRGVVVVP
jgi:D-arabinose 1-dehydrogenase-like Zn-dependent alcohol dehydrogenase